MKLVFICILSVLPVQVLLAQADSQTEYYAVLLDGKKIGSMTTTRLTAADKATTTEEIKLTIVRAQTPLTVVFSEKAIETLDGKPLGFESTVYMSGVKQSVVGKVTNGQAKMTVSMMGAEQEKTFPWPEGAVMAEGFKILEKSKGLAKGTAYSAKIFLPSLAISAVKSEDAVENVHITIGDQADIDLFGRVVRLTGMEVIEEVTGQTMTLTNYVNSDYQPQKLIVPFMGLELHVLACDRNFAMSKNDVVDFLDKFLVQSPVPITDAASKDSITYELTPLGNAQLQISADDSQTVKKQDNLWILTVKPAQPDTKAQFPYKGTDPDPAILEALKPSSYIQSDDPAIVELSRKAVGSAKSTAEAVKNIESFVGGYIEKKDLSVGYASASEVAQSRKGDCSEHAVLSAALCRAAGIPARVVVGLAYVEDFLGKKNVFVGHAWTQARIGDKWIGLDATRPFGRVAPDHIALTIGNGDPADFLSLVNTLGCFKITGAAIEDKPK